MIFLILNSKDWIDAVIESAPISQYVLIVLGLFSLVSWAVIFDRTWLLSGLKRQNHKVRQWLHPSQDLEGLLKIDRNQNGGNFFQIIKAASDEIEHMKASLSEAHSFTEAQIDIIVRSMKRSMSEELVRMEKNLTFLATTASASPYMGLFGTVWGVMESFRSIGEQGSASLAVVAPGISDALIATAAGLAAAIPAVMAYNYFVNKIKVMSTDMQNVMSEIINVIHRQSKLYES